MRRAVVAVGLLLALGLGLYALSVSVAAGLPDVRGLQRHVPARTALMRDRDREAREKGRAFHVDQRWVSYDRISPLLRRAVLVAEDDAFFSHGGLDWEEIRSAARTNLAKGRIVRGGSTITQQLAKNLYLGNERTITRKLKEVLLAKRLEAVLSKRRIFELYLNLIEWGDGVFGAEAAARRYFGVPAADLNARQATLLAAIIINPRRYSPIQPSRRIESRVRLIASRLRRRGYFDADQYALAIGRAPERHGFFDWLFGPPQPAPTHSDSAPPIVPEGATAPPDTVTSDADTLAASPL